MPQSSRLRPPPPCSDWPRTCTALQGTWPEPTRTSRTIPGPITVHFGSWRQEEAGLKLPSDEEVEKKKKTWSSWSPCPTRTPPRQSVTSDSRSWNHTPPPQATPPTIPMETVVEEGGTAPANTVGWSTRLRSLTLVWRPRARRRAATTSCCCSANRLTLPWPTNS